MRNDIPLFGLVLAGGESRRMGRDKAALPVNGRAALAGAYDLCAAVCDRVFVSVRPGGRDPLRASFPNIEDRHGGIGPADGIASAQATHPHAAWLVVACDLPRLSKAVLGELLAHRDPGRDATAYISSRDGLPEPLCAIYEPSSAAQIATMLSQDLRCPRKMLLKVDTRLIDQSDPEALDNVNTPRDWSRFAGSTA